jgi:hypothetical protein
MVSPSTARSEAVAAATGGGGGGGGGDRHDADSRHQNAHSSTDDSSVNSLAADSHLGSSQLPGGSTLESVESNVLGGSFSLSIIGSARMLETIGTLTNDVVGTIAPVETAPTLLAAGTDAAMPVAGGVRALDVPTITDLVDPPHMGYLTGEVQSPVPDLLGGIAAGTAGSTAPTALDSTVAAGSSGNQASNSLHVADLVGNLATHAPATAGAVVDGIDPALAPPPPSSDTDPSSHGVTDTSIVAAHHIGSAGSGNGSPVLPDIVELQAAAPDTTGALTDHAVVSAAPVVDTTDSVLAVLTGAASQSTMLSQTAASDSVGAHTLGSSAPALDVSEPTPATGSGATGDVAQPGNVASDILANAASVVDTTEPVLERRSVAHQPHDRSFAAGRARHQPRSSPRISRHPSRARHRD